MTAAVGAALQTFAVDKAHSEATFQVRHLVTKVRGRFTDFAGTLQFDEGRPEQGAVSFEVATASIDTGTADRDQPLRSEAFFFVDKHPTITSASSRVTRKTSHGF